jgi:hypothetical protein
MKYPLLKFDGAVAKDPAIESWFQGRPPELSAIAQEWFRKMRRCGPDVLEVLHDGFPTLCVEDAPFAYVNVFSSHLNVGFFHGASLRDPSRILQGTGKYMRHVKLKPDAWVDGAALEELIKAAYADIRERLRG